MTITPEIIVILTGFGTLLSFVAFLAGQQAGLRVKVDTLWDSYLRRSEREATRSGLGEKNSPLKIVDPRVYEALAPLLDELHSLYIRKGQGKTDLQLFQLVEQYFGTHLLKAADMLDLENGGTMAVLAVAAMKEDDQSKTNIDKILHQAEGILNL